MENQKTSGKLSDFFSESDYDQISAIVKEVEKNTSGEVKVVILMHWSEGLENNIDGQALSEFAKHGLHNTRDKTGVLILVVMSARQLKILADEGINAKLPEGYLQEQVGDMLLHFVDGMYADGICAVVASVGDRLAQFFPRKEDDTNELSDEVVVED